MPDSLHAPLLAWFDAHRRDLPWRRTRAPYAIWVSEIMLQQTQVATVIPYWERWMARFPSVEALAAASDQDTLELWQGLGYYRRCRLLKQGAEWVVAHGLPTTASGWREVPGVGPYTAGAIASIAMNEPAALVDGNVERVYARLTGDDAEGPRLNKAAWRWAEREVHGDRPGDWNQALMELGATVCKPVSPSCGVCPVRSSCVAFAEGRTAELPTKAAKQATVSLTHAVWVPVHGGLLGVRQIPAGQWWEGLWEFPRADAGLDLEVPELRAIVGPGERISLGKVRHAVTHHRIQIEASVVQCTSASEKLRWVSRTDLETLPMPAPQRKVLALWDNARDIG